MKFNHPNAITGLGGINLTLNNSGHNLIDNREGEGNHRSIFENNSNTSH